MRIIVTGSRNWEGVYGEARISTVLNIVLALAEVLGQKLTVAHGGYPRGADRAADNWARRREDSGVTVEVFEPNWAQFGGWAGPLRNKTMVEAGADMCIGFVRGPSRGTALTLELARQAAIPTFVVSWEEET